MTCTSAMAKEPGPSNIHVSAPCPGMISTANHDTFNKDARPVNVAKATAHKGESNANEVTDAVAYLASTGSCFLTGVNFDINGSLFYT